MLQQTQAGPGGRALPPVPGRFPTPGACAARRARRRAAGLGRASATTAGPCNLHRAGQRAWWSATAGRSPPTWPPCGRCPGVGPYTARAVLAFAFEADDAVVDTNVARVLARAVAGASAAAGRGPGRGRPAGPGRAAAGRSTRRCSTSGPCTARPGPPARLPAGTPLRLGRRPGRAGPDPAGSAASARPSRPSPARTARAGAPGRRALGRAARRGGLARLRAGPTTRRGPGGSADGLVAEGFARWGPTAACCGSALIGARAGSGGPTNRRMCVVAPTSGCSSWRKWPASATVTISEPGGQEARGTSPMASMPRQPSSAPWR